MNIDQKPSVLEFTNPKLKETIFEVNNNNNQDYEISLNLIVFNSEITTKSGYSGCDIGLTLTNFDDSSIAEDIPFKLKVTMGANFKWPTSTDANVVSSFIETNAPSTLLSYIRPFVSQLTGLTDFGIQQIPFINFVTSKEN